MDSNRKCRLLDRNTLQSMCKARVVRRASVFLRPLVIASVVVWCSPCSQAEESASPHKSGAVESPVRFRLDEVSSIRTRYIQQDSRVVRDVRYDPQPIGAITTSIDPPGAATESPRPTFDVVPEKSAGGSGNTVSTPYMWKDRRFSTESKVALSRPDGGWVVQRLHGPVARFEHLPLYFEEPGLERCGDTTICFGQTLLSAAHFYGTIAVLPYKMTNQPPWRPVCSEYRCQDQSLSARYARFRREFTAKPVAVQATSLATMFLIFP